MSNKAIPKTQPSDMPSDQRFGPLEIKDSIGKNAMRLYLPQSISLNPVLQVINKVLYKKQHPDIVPSITKRS